MGLCKCPKKKVTNQFCFEHRVNVCEYCMVGNHPNCVIQSYLLWLQDSDYNPNCSLCHEELNKSECIRLLCYHVYHWKCLDSFARNLPLNTAPAGYSCPSCQGPIFPASNIVSPIAEHIKNKLTEVNWARNGLGLPLLTQPEYNSISYSNENKKEDEAQNPHNDVSSSSSYINTPVSGVNAPGYSPSPHNSAKNYESVISVNDSADYRTQSRNDKSLSTNSVSSPRKLFDTTDQFDLKSDILDHDENKYKRRSAFEWLSRWFRSRLIRRKSGQVGHLYQRYAVAAIIFFFVLVTVIMIFSHLGRISAEKDPMLDPKRNPVIRVQED